VAQGIYEVRKVLGAPAEQSMVLPILYELASVANISLDDDTTQLLTLDVRRKNFLDTRYALDDLKRAFGGRKSSLVRLLASRVLVDLLPGDPFDPVSDLPACGLTLLAATAERLFEYGMPQFDALASTVVSIADWLRVQRFHRPLLLESPLGNMLPTQALLDRLVAIGLEPVQARVMAPREDRRNRLKFRDFVSDLRRGAYGSISCVVYLDDVQSGSRFKKAYETLSKELSKAQVPFLATGLVFRRAKHLSAAQKPLWTSVRKKLTSSRKVLGPQAPPAWVEFPDCPQVPGAQGPLSISTCPVWGDDDLVSGIRKVTLIFHFIEQYQYILKELTKSRSSYRAILHWTAQQGLWGEILQFDDAMLRHTYTELNTLVDWKLVESHAEVAFKEDFEGTLVQVSELDLQRRRDWIRQELRDAVSSHRLDGMANVLIGSLEVLYEMTPRQLLLRSSSERKHEARYCHVAIEYNQAFRTLNSTLRKAIGASWPT